MADQGIRSPDQPLTSRMLDCICHRCARECGLPNPEDYTPRILRHYFAAMWIKHEKPEYMLQQILGHSNPLALQFYLARLIFFEDIQSVYDQVYSQVQTQSESDVEMCQDLKKLFRKYFVQGVRQPK